MLQLAITGTADIAGRVDVTVSRKVQSTDAFRMVTWASHQGDFQGLSGLLAPPDAELKPAFPTAEQFVLVANPTQPPTVVRFQPFAEAVGSVNSLTVEFSEPILPETFTASTVQLRGPGDQRIPVGSPRPDPAGHPSGPRFLVPFNVETNLGTYRVTVANTVRDFAGLAMSEPFEHYFELVSGGGPETYASWAARQFTDAERTDPRVGGPASDPDGDGYSNEEEYNLFKDRGWRLNPKLRDSDADGFNDESEVFAGADPGDASALPTLELRPAVALEFAFPTRVGVSYRIQRTTDFLAWENVSETIVGDGGIARTLVSARLEDLKFFRVVEQ